MAKRKKALATEQAALAAEAEAARMISGGDMPASMTVTGPTDATVSTGATGPTGPTGAGGGDGLTPYERFLKSQEQAKRQDAFQFIASSLQNWGIEGLTDTVFSLMSDPNIGDQQAIYKLKFDTTINPATNKPWNEAYAKRFAANFERIKAGKPALSEGDYLTAERSYARALQGMGVSKLATRANFNKFISGDVSVDEVVDRVNIAINRIENAPKATKDALAQFYPKLSVLDIAEAVLDPEITLPALRRQVAAAEVGGGAITAGLGITQARAEELSAMGVTGAQAREGFQTVAEVVPAARRLSDIYRETPLTQAEVESEVFKTSGALEARRKRQSLAEREVASFSGRAGATQGALARERAGQI